MKFFLSTTLLLVGVSTLASAFVLPQHPSSTVSFSTPPRASAKYARNGEFTVVEDGDAKDEVVVQVAESDRNGQKYIVDDEETDVVNLVAEMNEDASAVVGDAAAAAPAFTPSRTGQRLEYAALSPGTITTLQIQVGDLALARKAWKKRRRSGSPLLIPCSVLNLDRPSLVRDNMLYLLYKFGTGQKDGTVISLAELKRRQKSHLKGSLMKHATALGYETPRDLVEGLFQPKAIQDTYSTKVFSDPDDKEIYLKTTLSKYRALQKGSRATLLQVTSEDDISIVDTMKHTGFIRCKPEPDGSNSNENNNNRHLLHYEFPPLSAALRVSQKDEIDTGKIKQGSIHPAALFDFDAQGDGGSPLLTLSLNPTRKPTAKKAQLRSAAAFTAPKYTPIRNPLHMLEGLAVGDGPYEAQITRLAKGYALVDFGVGRKFAQSKQTQEQKEVGTPEFVKVFGMLRFKDALDPEYNAGSNMEQSNLDEEEGDVFADMDEMLKKAEIDMEGLEEGESMEDVTHLIDFNDDGSLNYHNPETGEVEIVSADISEDEEDNEEEDEAVDQPITFAVPSSVQKAQRGPRTIRLHPGETLPVYILSASKQSGQFRVTTDPSLVVGKTAKVIKNESSVSKKLEKLSQMLGGLHKAEELKGREYDGTVKATSQTGDWLYVQPNGDADDELRLPVGVATVAEFTAAEYSQGDQVRIQMDGIDEARGQLAMSVIKKLSP